MSHPSDSKRLDSRRKVVVGSGRGPVCRLKSSGGLQTSMMVLHPGPSQTGPCMTASHRLDQPPGSHSGSEHSKIFLWLWWLTIPEGPCKSPPFSGMKFLLSFLCQTNKAEVSLVQQRTQYVVCFQQNRWLRCSFTKMMLICLACSKSRGA